MRERQVLFRVYREYFDMISTGQKDYEARPGTRYWSRVASRRPEVAVFQSGRRIHRRRITEIEHTSVLPFLTTDSRLTSVFAGRPVIIFRLGGVVP
jgi:hypothetical protein